MPASTKTTSPSDETVIAAWIVAFGPLGAEHTVLVPLQESLPQVPLTYRVVPDAAEQIVKTITRTRMTGRSIRRLPCNIEIVFVSFSPHQ